MRSVLVVLLAATSVAQAQPLDPYAPAPAPPAPAAPADDPVLAEQIAASLVVRAQQLYDARVFVDAKQLAVEALVTSPKGAAAEHAKFLITSINDQLGIVDPGAQPPPDLTPITDPTLTSPPLPPQPEAPSGHPATATRIHGALYTGLLGTMIGSLFSKDTPAGGAIPMGLAAGVVGGLYVPRLVDKLGWRERQVRTAGMGSVWGGVVGGLIADAVKTEGTTAREVLVGASIGSTVGLLGGAGLASRDRLTRGDVALIDTLAGIGVFGGFSMGMLMQPAETEAYSVNAVIGGIGGIVVGVIAAPNTNTTPRRMLRVAGLAAIGGAAPFLLYAGIHDGTTSADERVVGLLSSAGLVVGAYVGFRLTRDLDVDRDVLERSAPAADDAPAAVIGRSSDGRWALGALTVQPLSPALAPQRGLAMPLVGATF